MRRNLGTIALLTTALAACQDNGHVIMEGQSGAAGEAAGATGSPNQSGSSTGGSAATGDEASGSGADNQGGAEAAGGTSAAGSSGQSTGGIGALHGGAGASAAGGGAGTSGSETGGTGLGGSETGGSETGGSAGLGGSETGGSAGTSGSETGGSETGGSAALGGSASGGSVGSGGAPGGAGGNAGYDPCAGKDCGEICSVCAPDDTECVADPVVTACDPSGQCVAETANLCQGQLSAETDAARYGLDESGVATLHNDTQGVVYLPGCEAYYYELQVGGDWTFYGPEAILCDWEGEARPVAPAATFEAIFGPFTAMSAGTWRIRFTVGHGCQEGLPMNQDNCASTQDVLTPAFVVEAAACGDSAVMARYFECASAANADSCEALGGTWDVLGLDPEPFCQCPTGDGDCPCVQDSDCVTGCFGDAPVSPNDDCAGVTEGICAAGPKVGCWCLFDTPGVASAICID